MSARGRAVYGDPAARLFAAQRAANRRALRFVLGLGLAFVVAAALWLVGCGDDTEVQQVMRTKTIDVVVAELAQTDVAGVPLVATVEFEIPSARLRWSASQYLKKRPQGGGDFRNVFVYDSSQWSSATVPAYFWATSLFPIADSATERQTYPLVSDGNPITTAPVAWEEEGSSARKMQMVFFQQGVIAPGAAWNAGRVGFGLGAYGHELVFKLTVEPGKSACFSQGEYDALLEQVTARLVSNGGNPLTISAGST